MRVIIAGGGTGGHLFPGISIAEAFKIREGRNEVLFVGSRRGIEEALIPKIGHQLRTISVSGVRGKPLTRKLVSLWNIPLGITSSIRIINEFKPDLVIGLGGYTSAPVVICQKTGHENNGQPRSPEELQGVSISEGKSEGEVDQQEEDQPKGKVEADALPFVLKSQGDQKGQKSQKG